MILRWIVIAILISAAATALPTIMQDKKLDGGTPERILQDLKARLTRSTVDGREASGIGVEDDPDDLQAGAAAEASGLEHIRRLQEGAAKDNGLSPEDADELRRLQGLPPEEQHRRVLTRTPSGAAEASEKQREADGLLEKLKGRNSAEGTEKLGR